MSQQVFPLADAKDAQTGKDILDENDVKIEVMRSRGAGGQVSFAQAQKCWPDHPLSACQQNRISSPLDASAYWSHCLDARQSKPGAKQNSRFRRPACACARPFSRFGRAVPSVTETLSSSDE